MPTAHYRWRLAELADRRGIGSASELARRLGEQHVRLSRSQAHRLMTGRPSRLDLDLAAALCTVLDCSLDELVDRERTTRHDVLAAPGTGVDEDPADLDVNEVVPSSSYPDVHDVESDGVDDDGARTRNLLGAVTLELTERTEREIAVRAGLSAIEATALTALQNVADGHGIDELRMIVGLSQPGCARLVDRLEQRHLVRRGGRDGDRRAVTVSLTDAGRDAVALVIAARAAAADSLVASVGPRVSAALAHGLAEIARSAVDGRPDRSDRFCRRCDPVACGFPHHCPATVFSSSRG